MSTEIVPTAEELVIEQQALADVKEDEVRAKIIEDYGFDETADSDKIEKAVAKDMEHRKKLYDAIGQKIKYRKLAGDSKPNPAPKKEEKNDDKNDLTTKDVIAITNAKIHEDDIDEVVEYAKFKGISVSEALKSSVVKATLSEREELRKTANATSTTTQRRSNAKLSDKEIMKKANAGEVPEKGTDDAEALFWARRGGKR